jgi:hypothetical protein
MMGLGRLLVIFILPQSVFSVFIKTYRALLKFSFACIQA